MIIHNDVSQGSDEWKYLRLGKVTGSRLKEVMGKDNLSLVDELIAEQVSEELEEVYINKSMQWGIDWEPVARKEYEKLNKRSVGQCGFLQSDKYPLLGVSPDGLVGAEGAIEIKCPGTKTHVRYIRQSQIPNEYKYQVVQYFLVHEDLKWLDFVSYDPRFKVKPMFIHRVLREELRELIEECTEAIEKFFTKLDKIKSEILF